MGPVTFSAVLQNGCPHPRRRRAPGDRRRACGHEVAHPLRTAVGVTDIPMAVEFENGQRTTSGRARPAPDDHYFGHLQRRASPRKPHRQAIRRKEEEHAEGGTMETALPVAPACRPLDCHVRQTIGRGESFISRRNQLPDLPTSRRRRSLAGAVARHPWREPGTSLQGRSSTCRHARRSARRHLVTRRGRGRDRVVQGW
jgi:hypothetical protein